MDLSLVSVVIPSLGRHAALLSTIRDLLDQDYSSLEILVVDQNLNWPEQLAGQSRALRSDPRVRWFDRFPVGVVRARNFAAAQSRGELLLFVDDDVWIPDTSFVRHHVETHRDASLACVCGRELKPHQVDAETRRPLQVQRAAVSVRRPQASALGTLLAFDRSQPDAAQVAVFSTCNGSIKREAFLSVGGFDESFRGASYGDDADLVLRMSASGLRCVYDPRPWLVHLMAPTGGLRMSDVGNRFSDYDKCLSGLIFMFRHAEVSQLWPILYGWVLRRSILLRRNVVRPWRQPMVALGLAKATVDAWRAVRRGPISELTQHASSAMPRGTRVHS